MASTNPAPGLPAFCSEARRRIPWDHGQRGCGAQYYHAGVASLVAHGQRGCGAQAIGPRSTDSLNPLIRCHICTG
jgi:hypothetical protein